MIGINSCLIFYMRIILVGKKKEKCGYLSDPRRIADEGQQWLYLTVRTTRLPATCFRTATQAFLVRITFEV